MGREKHRLLYVRGSNDRNETISRIAAALDKLRDVVIVEMTRLGKRLLGNRYGVVAVDELLTAVSPAVLHAPLAGCYNPHSSARGVRNGALKTQGAREPQEWLKRPEQLEYG